MGNASNTSCRPVWRWWLFCLGCWAWFRLDAKWGLSLLGWAVHPSWLTEAYEIHDELAEVDNAPF